MTIHIFGGGTFSHVRNHLALAAPAFGATARKLHEMFQDIQQREHSELWPTLHLTKMADPTSQDSASLVTNEDVAKRLDHLIERPDTRVIIMNAALCDFHGEVNAQPSGKHAARLKTRDYADQRRSDGKGAGPAIELTVADKLIGKIRKTRKDIFLVAFKTTTGATPDEQYIAGLNLLKANSCNLVLANDTVTRNNMIIAPEETRYFETTDREEVLRGLVKMVLARKDNTFTRSTVVGDESDTIAWTDDRVPENLRTVVDHCIERGAYKKFRGVTAGHFAVRLSPTSVLTSKRKRDFNDLENVGLVQVDYEGLDKVIAHGAKPSVGGQSQRIVFDEHPDLDCIVHAHVPMREDAPDRHLIAMDMGQWSRECGSHQCGKSVSDLLQTEGDIRAVMIDNHGPNIVFSRSVPASTVIDFIERNFDLEAKTGGLVEV